MKALRIIALFVGFVLMSACASNVNVKLDDYVTDVESKCQNWTEEDWEASIEKYEGLIEEYERNYDSYTPEQREAANKAIGRYSGLLIKHGLNEAGGVMKELGNRLPSLIEGFMSAFDSEQEQDNVK